MMCSSCHVPSRNSALLARPLQPEANFFVHADRARVERKDLQLDAVQACLFERVLQQRARCVCAVAFAPVILVADKDAKDGMAVRPVNLVQSAVADQPAFPQVRMAKTRESLSPRW